MFIRPGELRNAAWTEFDLDAAQRGERPMSDNGVLSALQRMGFPSDEVTDTDSEPWRVGCWAERLNADEAVIEAQPAHAVKDSQGRAYNRTKFLEQRRKILG